jgi:hypothetical protein
VLCGLQNPKAIPLLLHLRYLLLLLLPLLQLLLRPLMHVLAQLR